MSAKHTPGPWEIEKDGSAEHRNEANVIIGANGTMIVYGQANDADARLIAAAPELLEFVKEWLDRQGSDENYMTTKASKAIFKATGEAK